MELGIYGQDDLAGQIVDRWLELSNERDNNLRRLSDLRAYLFAPDTSFTEVGKLNWKNRTVTPKLTQIYDNLTAQYISALHPNDAWVSFEGNKDEDQIKESKVETYLRHKLKESNFIVSEREVISDWVWAGYACMGVEHVNEMTKSMDGSGEDIVKYYGPRSFRVSPYDYVLEPRATSFDESIFIRRRLVSRESLMDHNNEKSLIQYDESSLKKIKDIEGYVRLDEDNLKDTDLRVDGFSTPQEYFQSGMVELMELWGDIYDKSTGKLLKNYTICIADRMFVLWNQPNPMWNGSRPYSFTSWRNRPDNLYGQSPLEQLVGMQYRIDHLENAKADILDLTIHPTVDVFGDDVDDYEIGPGVINYLGTDERVEYKRPDASALQVNSEIFNLMNLMEEMAGAPKQTAGLRTPGEKTAFEVSQLNEGAMKMFLEKTKHFEQTLLKQHLNNFYTLLAMNFNAEDTFRVLNDVEGTIDIISATKEDVIRDGNFKLIGSENYERRNKVLLDLRDGTNILYSNERTAAHVDSYKVAKMVERELDWEKHELVNQFSGMTEQVDAQLAVQMHQQERQEQMGQGVQDAVPTEPAG